MGAAQLIFKRNLIGEWHSLVLLTMLYASLRKLHVFVLLSRESTVRRLLQEIVVFISFYLSFYVIFLMN